MFVEFEQFVEDLVRFVSSTRESIDESEHAERAWSAFGQIDRLLRRSDRLLELFVCRVSVAEKPVRLVVVRIHRDDAAKLLDCFVVATRVLQEKTSLSAD